MVVVISGCAATAALAALTAATVPALIERTLQLALSDAVKVQDCIYLFRGGAGNSHARRLMYVFMKDNWVHLHARLYKGSLSLLASIVGETCAHFSNEADAENVQTFFAMQSDTDAIQRKISQSVEQIRIRAQWLAADRTAVAAWFKAE